MASLNSNQMSGILEQIVEGVLLEVAKEVTSATKAFVREKLYMQRSSSKHYDRSYDFLDTFEYIEVGSEMISVQTIFKRGKVNIKFLLRDENQLTHRGRARGQFARHSDWQGTPLGLGTLDTLINDGYEIKGRGPDGGMTVRKRIKGIKFRQFARKYLKDNWNRLINEKFIAYGIYPETVTSGYKRLGIELGEYWITADEE